MYNRKQWIARKRLYGLSKSYSLLLWAAFKRESKNSSLIWPWKLKNSSFSNNLSILVHCTVFLCDSQNTFMAYLNSSVPESQFQPSLSLTIKPLTNCSIKLTCSLICWDYFLCKGRTSFIFSKPLWIIWLNMA